jgi:hypothetical protein
MCSQKSILDTMSKLGLKLLLIFENGKRRLKVLRCVFYQAKGKTEL